MIHTAEQLVAFEAEIAGAFNSGLIRAPVHLAGGNENQLIDIFRKVKTHDWVLCQWRSHYHCLLKGVPPEVLKRDILAGKSITLCYPEYQILSSAIVGGVLPIAMGLAWAIKRAGGLNSVWAFVGDMTAATGIFSESYRYALGHALPLNIVIEDNGKSVCTDTKNAWSSPRASGDRMATKVSSYRYELPWPHAGAGVHVKF